jgi:aspartyl-tRNA(Asn)/glutamyl-tRNA(Gln) amidotransferase subunit A
MKNISQLSLVEVADMIRSRKLSSEEVTRACIERAQALQPKLNCFIALEVDDALAAARSADADLAKGVVRGPLHGVPLAHKDMYYRKGKISTCGSEIRRDWVADSDSTALARLRNAGAIQLGTLNMSQFALNPTGHNVHMGHCRNPWNTAYITGGSSSGSGASVAARIVFGALGSDTGGSIRLPASNCGCQGSGRRLAGLAVTVQCLCRFQWIAWGRSRARWPTARGSPASWRGLIRSIRLRRTRRCPLTKRNSRRRSMD